MQTDYTTYLSNMMPVIAVVLFISAVLGGTAYADANKTSNESADASSVYHKSLTTTVSTAAHPKDTDAVSGTLPTSSTSPITQNSDVLHTGTDTTSPTVQASIHHSITGVGEDSEPNEGASSRGEHELDD